MWLEKVNSNFKNRDDSGGLLKVIIGLRKPTQMIKDKSLKDREQVLL